MALTPYPYQIEGTDFLRAHDRCLLADDMGTGKTMQTLRAFGDRGLIVCPPGLKYNWADECEVWRPDLRPLIMEGLGLGRFKWPDRGELVICGYNQLPDWLNPPPHKCEFPTADKSARAKARRKELKKLRKQFNEDMASQEKFGSLTAVAADEAQYVKNQKSNRARKFRMLSALAARTWMLTGTPMPRGNPFDLLGILRACHLDQTIFPNYLKFKRLANISEGFGAETYGTPRPAFHAALAPYMLRRTKADVAPWLPPKVHRTVRVEMDKPTAAKLESLPADFVRKIEHAQTASELTKLATLPGFSEFSMCRKMIARARIPAMLEYVELCEENDQPLLVFSAHREPIEALEGREGWRVIHGNVSAAERQAIVREQKGLRGIAVTIKSGGAGLNLASFSTVLFVDLDWDVTNNAQAEDRAHRHGQESESVMYSTLTSSHPVDMLITEKLQAAAKNISIAIEGKV